MNRIMPLLLLAIFGLCGLASANIRAPYMREYNGPEELRSSIPNLTVMKEDILFQCDLPYRGSLDNVQGQRREVRTSAEYAVKSETETDAGFDFILNVNQPVAASINGIPVPVGDPELIQEHTKRNYFGGDADDGRYRVSFSGRMNPGMNTISVTYSQPMGVLERMGGFYPFYISSRFISSFSYELAPLREWRLDDTFTMNIRITFKDDTGWLKPLFGSKYRIRLYNVTRKEYESTDYRGEIRKHNRKDRTEITGRINRKAPGDIYDVRIEFNKDFPDIFEVRCEY